MTAGRIQDLKAFQKNQLGPLLDGTQAFEGASLFERLSCVREDRFANGREQPMMEIRW